MREDPIVITGMARTPIGAFLGDLSSLPATELGAVSVRAALQNARVPAVLVTEVVMGCVLPAGLGQAPARQAALGAGLPQRVPCATVNKMCGSGMQAAILAHDGLVAGTSSVTVAGGMESMSNAPYLLAKVRTGQRMGHGSLVDHMFLDGLEDAYERGRAMGTFAEDTARRYGFSRDEQDAFAVRSLERARRAGTDGSFAHEIAAVEIRGRKTPVTITSDEQPRRASIERIPHLKPAFARDGTVTAANSSSISDGAAAVVLMRRSEAERRGIEPLVTIRAHAVHAQEPRWFTTAPVQAIRSVLERAGWSSGEDSLYEINEAFAVVVLAAMRDLGLVADRVNVRGGACALGHPIGASGARIVVTLVSAMMTHGLRRGVAALCIGGGEATALAIEREP